MGSVPLSVRGLRARGEQAGMALLLALIGFVVVTQIRTEWLIKRDLRIPSRELGSLGFALRQQEQSRAALEAEVADLRAQLQEYEKAAAEGRLAAAQMNRQLIEMRALVGLTPLEGPGIAIVLDDSPRALQPGEDPNKVILHYSDLHAIVAELWAAGAEAIAINGERIVASTGINCVGTTILCNTKRMVPPYHVVAIGDPGRLTAYLRRPGGALELLGAFDFPVRITRQARVVVPAYRGAYRFEHTKTSE
jgi:uncharacterized protein YlxW (UPF0749 family)